MNSAYRSNRLWTAAAAVVAIMAGTISTNTPAAITAPLCLAAGFLVGAILARLQPIHYCQECTTWPAAPAIGVDTSNGSRVCKLHARLARAAGIIVIEAQQPIPFSSKAAAAE